ncbi:hypothetical protein F4820DRAFT_448440 [Hypoxylon rubiginosum]|uniref:Uncharacterized protein n=1 Tax=Hypoxylon rubiginosum TaxID=110542 RepID=A0ACB9Z1N6_9PEZI|nr:hypothetical protein F4820DRAFT_448440 [Hypoxylon rubiginosum]
MLGLEKRLADAYKVRAKYGILDGRYLHRSLLRQTGDEKDQKKPLRLLRKINFAAGNKVPSWSWMAVMGPIKYMDAPFNLMIWGPNIESPLKKVYDDMDGEWKTQAPGFIVPAMDVAQSVGAEDLIYDRPEYYEEDGTVINGLKCVQIGREKTEDPDSPLFYTLLLIPKGTSGEEFANYENRCRLPASG